MSSDWREVRLGEVATTLNGAGIKQEFFVVEGIPLARVSNFAAGTIDLSDCIFVDREHAERWVSHRINFGDVVVATVGSWPPNWSSVVGKVVRAPASAVGALQNQNTCRVVAHKGTTDQRFLYYLLSTQEFIFFAANAAAGSANQARLGIASLEKFSFALPSLSEQQEIGNFLGTLDDRITLLRETNATLEAIAQALFKSWFVDFDPVRAKTEGRQPEGMDTTTAALFPDSFEESEQGLVPRGWGIGELGDVFTLRNERTQPTAATKSLPYVPIESIGANTPFLSETKSGEEANSSLTLFRDGDILFGAMRPYFHKVCIAPFDGVTRTTVFTLAARDTNARAFALFLAYQKSTIEYATQHSEGSTIPYAKWRNSLERMPVVLPNSIIQQSYSKIVFPLIEQANANNQRAKTLTQLRDTLLPRLISGQLRLPEAEALLENSL